MLEKVKLCVKDLKRLDKNGKRRPYYDLTLGDRLGLSLNGVCRDCFAMCYGCSHNLVDSCCKEIREPKNAGQPLAKSADPVFNDRSTIDPYDTQFFKDIKALCESKGVDLTSHDRAMLCLPNTVKSQDAYHWMEYYFTSYGCRVPNSEQIHLDHVTFKELWQEYVTDIGEDGSLQYNAFIKL